MRYKLLGNTGLKVSEICMGTMTFGGRSPLWTSIGGLDEKTSTEMVAKALDAGISFFDTANGYGDGDSEIFLGRALGARRPGVVIATKVGFPTGPGPNDKGLSRNHILDSAEASLRRLGTDYIDLYMVHRRDPQTPVEETMQALDDLVRWGKVRYVAVSNFPAWEIAKANAVAEGRGWARFECLQAYYNLAARDIEREIIPYLQDQKIGLMVWSPLASGVLSGKYSRTGQPPKGARRESFDLGPVDYERVYRIVEVAREIAARQKGTVAQVAIAWLLVQPAVTSVIIGAKRMDQLVDNLDAIHRKLTEEDLKRLDKASQLSPEYPGWFLQQFDNM
jgi:aryl-alcohol dehydrogenase-like predicted oxidoreductase